MAPRAHVPDPAVSFVDADGLRFAFRAWGDGPTVIALHGFPDSADSWHSLGPAIAAAGFRVIAPYLRGYAPTARGQGDPDSERLGHDVLALIDALAGGRARVIGHDWGAEAVYAAARLDPSRIERLVAVAIPYRPALPRTLGAFWGARHFVTLRLPGAVTRFAAHDYAMVDTLYRRWSPTWTPDVRDLESTKNTLAAPGCLDAALGYYRALSFITPDFLKGPLAVPTLCVGGRHDPVLSEDDFARTGEHCRAEFRLAMIPGGHFCHRESEREFLDAVLPFLST